ALGDALEFLAVVFAERADHPFVDAVGHQQHFDALCLERFQLRAAGGGLVAVGGDVPDRVLADGHAADVVVQRDALRGAVALGAGEAQQPGDALAVVGVFADAFLERVAEGLVEGGEFLRLVLGQLLDQVEYALDAGSLDALELAIVLQDLAADVERQVVGVDHAAHEAQVVRQQLLGGVHDEDALDVELQPLALVAAAHHQVERRLRRQVQQGGEALAAFDAVVRPRQRVVEIVAERLVEALVVLVADLALGFGPQRGGGVGALELVGRLAVFFGRHADREGDVVGVLADQRLQLPALEELVLVCLQVQDHRGAALRLVDRLQRILALAVALPLHALAGRRIGAAGDHGDLVGDHEGGVEAHAELADQPRVGLLFAQHRLEEAPGAGAGDGADIGHHLVADHADAVVVDGDGARIRIPAHVDMQLAVTGHQLGLGDQLAQEDLLVRVQRVGDQVKDLGDFGFEFAGFGDGRVHGRTQLHRVQKVVGRRSPRPADQAGRPRDSPGCEPRERDNCAEDSGSVPRFQVHRTDKMHPRPPTAASPPRPPENCTLARWWPPWAAGCAPAMPAASGWCGWRISTRRAKWRARRPTFSPRCRRSVWSPTHRRCTSQREWMRTRRRSNSCAPPTGCSRAPAAAVSWPRAEASTATGNASPQASRIAAPPGGCACRMSRWLSSMPCRVPSGRTCARLSATS